MNTGQVRVQALQRHSGIFSLAVCTFEILEICEILYRQSDSNTADLHTQTTVSLKSSELLQCMTQQQTVKK